VNDSDFIAYENHRLTVANAELRKERDELEHRIKRLEEAGDAMETRLHLRKNISDQFVYKGDAESVENWNKAKEDKL
jgi:chaperonin cofactor prefoldin